MSKRTLILAVFFVATMFGIGALIWVNLSGLTLAGTGVVAISNNSPGFTGNVSVNSSTASTVNAAPAPEVKAGADWISIREYGLERSTNAKINGGGRGMRA